LDFKTKISRQLEQPKPKPLLAVYDLAVLPYSFDIVHFICNAEIERYTKSCDKVIFIFVCHESDPAPERSFLCRGKNNHWQYLYNILLASVRCYSRKKSILIFNNRKEFVEYFLKLDEKIPTFPSNYDPLNPPWLSGNKDLVPHCFAHGIEHFRKSSDFYCISPPNEQIKLARKWLSENVKDRHRITITLREYGFSTKRNSKISEWQKLVDSYSNEKYQFIVLRDYETLYDTRPLLGDNVTYCNEAVLDASFRAALYEECMLNLGVSNGPLMLAMQNKNSNFIIFKILCEERGCRLEDVEKYVGISYNENLPSMKEYQKVVWQTDDYKTLKKETDEMIARLAEGGFDCQK
tara:strand:- start:436 stop:1485 length:1050 start_codon:yes stop_codon:yes gene_type:complete